MLACSHIKAELATLPLISDPSSVCVFACASKCLPFLSPFLASPSTAQRCALRGSSPKRKDNSKKPTLTFCHSMFLPAVAKRTASGKTSKRKKKKKWWQTTSERSERMSNIEGRPVVVTTLTDEVGVKECMCVCVCVCRGGSLLSIWPLSCFHFVLPCQQLGVSN